MTKEEQQKYIDKVIKFYAQMGKKPPGLSEIYAMVAIEKQDKGWLDRILQDM